MLDQYLVDTPEQINVAYDIAGIGSRFLAAIIDTIVLLLLEGLVLFVLSFASSRLTIGESIVTAIAAVVSFAVLWGYYLVSEMLSNGQSIGKKAIGLRVVREGGRPVTFTASALRNVIRLVDFLPLLYGIGVVAMFIDSRARRLGDLAAGTLVVRERSPVSLDSLTQPVWAASPGAVLLPAGEIQRIEQLNDHDYMLVQEFLQRREALSPEARQRIAAQLAEGIRQRVEAPETAPAETLLLSVAAAYAAYRRRPDEPAAPMLAPTSLESDRQG